MRKNSLRQVANRLLKMDRRGKSKDRKHRGYVIHKMIEDLYTIQKIPPSWKAVETDHIHRLVHHWKQCRINPATIMRYMTIIRGFLKYFDCQPSHIDNKSLQLVRMYKHKRVKKGVEANIWHSIQEPCVRLIMALQIEFGLTFREAIHIQPFIHVQDKHIWITRDIAFNSGDRFILICTESQLAILEQFKQYTKEQCNIMQVQAYELIRMEWRNALIKQRLSALKSW